MSRQGKFASITMIWVKLKVDFKNDILFALFTGCICYPQAFVMKAALLIGDMKANHTFSIRKELCNT